MPTAKLLPGQHRSDLTAVQPREGGAPPGPQRGSFRPPDPSPEAARGRTASFDSREGTAPPASARGPDAPSDPFPGATRGRTSHKSCGKGFVFLHDDDSGEVKRILLRCHRWSCSICGPRKEIFVRHLALSGRPERLITLTLRYDKNFTLHENLARISTYRRLFFRAARKDFRVFEYFWVVELQKNGTPHIHILQRGDYIPKRWIKAHWKAISGSFVTDVRRLDSYAGGAHEISKYLLKSAAQLNQVAPRLRLYSHSKDWVIDEDVASAPPAHSYTFLFFGRMAHSAFVAKWESYGGQVIPDPGNPDACIIRPPPGPPNGQLQYDLDSFFGPVCDLATLCYWMISPSRGDPLNFACELALGRQFHQDTELPPPCPPPKSKVPGHQRPLEMPANRS